MIKMIRMIFLSRVRRWVFISLFSLFVWTTYFLVDSLGHVINIALGFLDFYTGKEWYFLPAFFGILFRFIGVLTALLIITLSDVYEARKFISIPLALEGLYHFSLIPSSISLFFRNYNFMGSAYLLKAFLVTPFLTFLAIKLNSKNIRFSALSKWIGSAFASYATALGITAIFRWLEMIKNQGITFLFTGLLHGIGFFNTILFMPLAACLATYGTYKLVINGRAKAFLYIGLSLIIMGLHYINYIIYSYFSSTIKFLMLTDIWVAPFCGLGLSIIISQKQVHKRVS